MLYRTQVNCLSVEETEAQEGGVSSVSTGRLSEVPTKPERTRERQSPCVWELRAL